mgnify:CR=1 FL=1
MIVSAQGQFYKGVFRRPQYGVTLNGNAKVSNGVSFPVGAQVYIVTPPITNSGPGDETWDVLGAKVVVVTQTETVFSGLCSGTVTIRNVDGKNRVVGLSLGGTEVEGNPFAIRDVDVTNPEPGFIQWELAVVQA